MFFVFFFKGILKESIEARDSCTLKDKLLGEQEKKIAHLTTELVEYQKGKREKSQERLSITEIKRNVMSIRSKHEILRADIASTVYEYSTDFHHIFEQIRQHLSLSAAPALMKKYNESALNNGAEIPRYREEERNVTNGIPNDFLSLASSSDSESLFIPRQSSDSLNPSPNPAAADTTSGAGGVGSSLYQPTSSTASILGNSTSKDTETSLCYPQKSRKFEREREQLIEKHREETRRQNILHKIQIDTLVRSMARRHSKKIRPFLTPSPELYTESTRMGQSEFLKSCIDRVEYVEEE